MHNGFSVVEAVSSCPTYYGRKNKKGSAVDLIRLIKENSIVTNDTNKAKEVDKMPIGIFKDITLPEYTEEYQKVVDKF